MRIGHMLMAGIGTLVAIVTGLSQVSAQDGSAPALSRLADVAGDAPTLSVMTYNVAGLPFPLRIGRDAAAERIGQRLRQMRDAGVQPHVVVLQEAFGPAQQAIGRAAGYRYMAFGPDITATAEQPMRDADKRFAADARLSRGERSGKLFGSGLVILSDYPIERVARAAFPAFACAGFDCLANKGVMLAAIRVPGAAQPVAVATFHLNAKKASGVSAARRDYAFARQVEAVGRFLRAELPADAPYVVAGDTNIGRSAPRRLRFRAMLASLPGAAAGRQADRTALDTCLAARTGCVLGSVADLRLSHAKAKDWEIFGSGTGTALVPVAADAPFGRDENGRMLSDHVGYMAVYRLDQRVRRPVQFAAR
jgi:endonuclease/exonuclease/phosphatase family metal-dependent hydrolase